MPNGEQIAVLPALRSIGCLAHHLQPLGHGLTVEFLEILAGDKSRLDPILLPQREHALILTA